MTAGAAPEVVAVEPDDVRLAALTRALLAEMDELYGGDGEDAPKPVVDGATYLVVVDRGEPIACGGIAPLHWPTAPPATAEVKRVYVDPSMRGRGVGRLLMDALLDLARSLGHERLWLETGAPQVGAVALYERSGWTRIEPYGQYAEDHRTRCYELVLSQRPIRRRAYGRPRIRSAPCSWRTSSSTRATRSWSAGSGSRSWGARP